MNEPLHVAPRVLDAARILADRIGIAPSERTVVAVGGESGSGKSTTALALQTALSERGLRATVLHLDGYFHLPPRANHEARTQSLSWVGPQEVNMELLQSHVDAFHAGATELEVPVVDYVQSSIEFHTTDISDSEVLIVEGTYALYLDRLDHGVFMPGTYLDTRSVRQARTREVYDPFVEHVLDIEHHLVQKSAPRAQFRITSNYKVECQLTDSLE